MPVVIPDWNKVPLDVFVSTSSGNQIDLGRLKMWAAIVESSVYEEETRLLDTATPQYPAFYTYIRGRNGKMYLFQSSFGELNSGYDAPNAPNIWANFAPVSTNITPAPTSYLRAS